MSKYLLLCACFLQTAFLMAQKAPYLTAKTVPEKVFAIFKDGRTALYYDKAAEAINAFDKAIKKEPTFIDAYLLRAEAYSVMKKEVQALADYEKVIQLDSAYAPKIYFSRARMAWERENYAEVETQLNLFLRFYKTQDDLRVQAYKRLEDAKFIPYALAHPVPFKPVNLGPKVNSEFEEYLPALTADNSALYITRRVGYGRNVQEDFYVSRRDTSGEWGVAKNVGPPINTDGNEGAESISADGKFIVYTVCNRPEDFGACDLYYSENIGGKWSRPQNIGNVINTKDWESQPSVTANADGLFFTRAPNSMQGNSEIMFAKRKPDGTWEEPKPVYEINTYEREESPFIHPDGQTLYFRSKGYPGFGSYDIYLSHKQPDGKWGKPENIGYPINTPGNEGDIIVDLTGKLAYYNSDMEGGYGGSDIYTFELPESARPKPVTYVKAIVYDAVTKERLMASTEMITLADGKSFLKKITDKDGSFMVCLPAGQDYALNVTRKGYLFGSENFSLTEGHSADKPFTVNIYLQPVPTASTTTTTTPTAGTPIILKNVFFESASAALRNESKSELDRLKNMLADNPNLKIQIGGHTDNVNSDAANIKLSTDRANAVRDYLIQGGIAPTRLTAKGYGESQPIDTNDTPEGRQRNRRTEFTVVQ